MNPVLINNDNFPEYFNRTVYMSTTLKSIRQNHKVDISYNIHVYVSTPMEKVCTCAYKYFNWDSMFLNYYI